jgi:hypothetical protein
MWHKNNSSSKWHYVKSIRKGKVSFYCGKQADHNKSKQDYYPMSLTKCHFCNFIYNVTGASVDHASYYVRSAADIKMLKRALLIVTQKTVKKYIQARINFLEKQESKKLSSKEQK